MSDQSIVNEYDDAYQEAYYAWNPYYPLADDDIRYYLGEQWDEKERQKLFQEGRNALVFNYIRRNINALIGFYIQHQNSSVVTPQEDRDQLAADQATKALLYAFNSGEFYKKMIDAFGGAVKSGWNLITLWMDYRDDPINGDIKFGREPYNGFITDPYLTDAIELTDCSYVIRRKYLSPEHVSSLLPDMKDEIYKIASYGWSRDDKFTWLPYQTQPNGQDFMAYNEYYKQGWEEVPTLVDKRTGEFMEWEGDNEGLRYFLQRYPQLTVVKRPKRYIECNVIVNDILMKREKNQFGLNEYPFSAVPAIWEPESEFWGLKLQSLVRCMRDPQKEANRRRSQMIDIQDSQINSGWMAKKNSVINPRSLFQTSQGKVIWKSDDAQPGDIEKIPPASIPQSFFALQKQFDEDIMNIMGMNSATMGEVESGNESGIMMMLRQGSSLLNLQSVMENARHAQKSVSKKALKMMANWKPEKFQRILNEPMDQIFFNKDFTKYDVSVVEGLLTPTQKQIYFRQMLDLYQATGGPQGSPITPQMLVEAAPLQGKSTLNKEIQQNIQQQQKEAQKSQQVQQELLNSQLEYNKASSVEKMAGAKERFTRSVANMGLEDERSARAVDDRASAALDRAKAMKELSSLDDDRLVKYLGIIRMMEEVNQREEEEIKEDDVNVSASGEQTAAPPQPANPLQGNPVEQNEPPMEV